MTVSPRLYRACDACCLLRAVPNACNAQGAIRGVRSPKEKETGADSQAEEETERSSGEHDSWSADEEETETLCELEALLDTQEAGSLGHSPFVDTNNNQVRTSKYSGVGDWSLSGFQDVGKDVAVELRIGTCIAQCLVGTGYPMIDAAPPRFRIPP